MESNKRRVISLLVDNQSGVLARVSNLFCRRGFQHRQPDGLGHQRPGSQPHHRDHYQR